jgi:hypothetical protein
MRGQAPEASDLTRPSDSIRTMQGILNSAMAAFTLLVMLMIGWAAVFVVTAYVERRVRGKSSVSAIWESFTWLWDNSNVIGIPVLVVGAVYLVWAMNYGPGLGGPTLLIVLLMGAATALVGLAPSLRRP